MLINLRNALMAGKRLPYDAEVEYLESTGTQYIDTGVILDSTYGIDICFAPMESASGVSEHGIFGSSVSGSGTVHNVLQIHSSAGGVGLWMPSNTRICNYAITVGDYQHWQINLGNANNVVVDGTNRGSTHPTTASACPYSVYLFAHNVGGSLKSGSCSSMRLASWKVYDGNGNLVQDCIAVRVGTVGYLYDRVSGKPFGNAGTGDFQCGPDVVPATWVDGEYWDTFGVATALSGASRCDNFIPVQPSSSVTFYLGHRPGGTTLYMVQYNANKERVNSTYNANGAARTITIPANCYYIRVSAETAKKNEAYIYDNTNDRYLLREGMVPID